MGTNISSNTPTACSHFFENPSTKRVCYFLPSRLAEGVLNCFRSAIETYDKKTASLFGAKGKKGPAAEAPEMSQGGLAVDIPTRSRSSTSTRRGSVFATLFSPEQPPKMKRERGTSSENVGEGGGGVLASRASGPPLSSSDSAPKEDDIMITRSSPGMDPPKDSEGVHGSSSAPVLKSPRSVSLQEEATGQPASSENLAKKKRERGHQRKSSIGSAGRSKGRRLSIFASVLGKKESDPAVVELDLDEPINRK
jgi:hypothetical protein